MKDLPPSQTPAADDPEEVPDFQSVPKQIAPRVHSLKSEYTTAKHRTFTKVYAMRCRWCFRAIIHTLKYPEIKVMEVDAASWDGNIYYIRGKHHLHYCQKKAKQIRKRRSDTFV